MRPGGWTLMLALQCRHAYFSDGVCRPLRAHPSAACLAQLARHRMLWRQLPGGGEIHAPADAPAGYDARGPLTILLVNEDPHLMNYTGGAWPQGPERLPSVWYLDNVRAQQGLLHPEDGYSVPERLPLMGRRFQWAPEQPVTVNTLALLDALGGTALEATPSAQQPQPLITLDLSALEEGRYTLLLNGQAALDFYLCDAPATRLWGVCALYAGGAIPPQRYAIALRGREIHWRYTLISPGADPDYRQCTVRGERRAAGAAAEPIAFSGEGEPLLVDGRKAVRYTSLQPLPLSEFPGDSMRFTLQTGDAGMGQGRSLRLPYAQGKVLARQYSDIYVYL